MKGITGGGRLDELYGERELIVMNRSFNFNCRKAVAFPCPMVAITTKKGFLPKSALEDHRPVEVR